MSKWILSAPEADRLFRLEVDASVTGVGAVLLQDVADCLSHPVSYLFAKFIKLITLL